MRVKISILLGFGELVNGIEAMPTRHLHSACQGKKSCSAVPCKAATLTYMVKFADQCLVLTLSFILEIVGVRFSPAHVQVGAFLLVSSLFGMCTAFASTMTMEMPSFQIIEFP